MSSKESDDRARSVDHRWMQTFTGRQFHPFIPDPETVCIEDIAHSLSFTCRYRGHCRDFYSVADHSVRVCDVSQQSVHAATALHRYALLHDAAEAYLFDAVAPSKASISIYRHCQLLTSTVSFKEMEHVVMAAIYKGLGLDFSQVFDEMREIVKQYDLILLATEKRDLMALEPAPWIDLPKPLKELIVPRGMAVAEFAFMQRAKDLGIIEQIPWKGKML